jgi:hypothetical protein
MNDEYEKIAFANIFIFLIVGGIGVFLGLDLRKWSSWLYGLYGLLSGLFVGLSDGDISGGLKLGVLFAFLVLSGGAAIRWHRQFYKGHDKK